MSTNKDDKEFKDSIKIVAGLLLVGIVVGLSCISAVLWALLLFLDSLGWL